MDRYSYLESFWPRFGLNIRYERLLDALRYYQKSPAEKRGKHPLSDRGEPFTLHGAYINWGHVVFMTGLAGYSALAKAGPDFLREMPELFLSLFFISMLCRTISWWDSIRHAKYKAMREMSKEE